MKKILALAMALVLTCGMLVACDIAKADDAQSLLENANAVLEKEPYTVTIKMNFESDNEELNQIFSVMNMEIPTTVDGKNIAMDMSMDMMGYSVGVKMTVVDMIMYYDMDLMGQSVKMKATMTEEQYQEFMAGNNTEMTIMPEDFAEQTVETKDGKKYIVCTGISDEALKELNDTIATALDSIGAEGTVSEVTYNVTLNDGKYESMDMVCVYSVTATDQSCNMTFTMGAEYSYDNIPEITVPEDANSYEEIDFGDLMG